MANTGLLPFVRGVDFTCNDFSGGKFPNATRYMTGVQWLRLDKTNLTDIPEELGTLMKLEHLSLKKNNIEKLHGELTELNCLRSLNVSHNKVKSSGIPSDLFKLEELTTLDLSNNRLNSVPEGLDKAKSLLVLNLSYNSIDSIPPALFIQLSDLLFLDLSNNQLETLPPQTRRLANLQTLILNNNPLGLFQLRQLPSLQCLKILQMRNTQRTPANIPTSLETLTSLSELDLSQNDLPKVPDALYTLPNLKRLNLSDNAITEISGAIELWQHLRNLNLSRNKLTALPSNLCKLQALRVLHVNDNMLDFEGIPSGIGKLSNLEVFSAANNRLEMIPEGLCRCGSLRRLNVAGNRLIALPEAVRLLPELRLEAEGNPELRRPAPAPAAADALLQFYNIDFSLQHQLRLAGAAPAPPAPACAESDASARRLRLRRGRRDAPDAPPPADAHSSGLILRGMQGGREADKKSGSIPEAPPAPDSLQPKRWDESLEKPPLDYSEFFDLDVGQLPGITVWEIENFLPAQVEEAVHGKFYEGDCYIVLRTYYDQQGSLTWDIHFWIGAQAPLDKCACAAIHAVHLRNLLGARCRTQRQEQGDESDDFIRLFPTPPMYIQGGRTPSGFYTVDDTQYTVRLYRVHTNSTAIHVIPVALEVDSLDPRHVFILDAGLNIYIWIGKKSKNTLRSKARLFAEKINKNERKNGAEITSVSQNEERSGFWKELGLEDGNPPEAPLKEHVEEPAEGWAWPTPRLYRVELGMGYLELPQVEGCGGGARPSRAVLSSRCVYLLDTHVDVCVWLGRRSPRLVRAAAARLAGELRRMLSRPAHARVARAADGAEPHVFRAHFAHWDDVIPVDFTRTARSVARTGADLQVWARKQETKSDLSALFTPRQTGTAEAEARRAAADWAEELDAMEAFVLEGRRFVRLPDDELGTFYSGDCYVFLCRYILPPQGEDADEEPEDDADSIQWVVYFWQGRMAGNMGYLTFTFGLEKKFRPLCHNLEVVRTYQQQESAKFMSHFNGKFIIKDGKRNTKRDPSNGCIELYELRSNGSILCSRLVQVKADSSQLNSAFCYILKVLFESKGGEEESGVNYVWLGSKATPEDVKVIEQIAEETFNSPWLSLQVLNEGNEPENFFWAGLGGKKPYEDNADFMQHTRLFRCSNERGYFTVSEKCTDFCQDDLADDDIMILDNGEHVFLWLGSRCSEVEIKLAFKSAQVYIQHMRVKQPDNPRKLFLTLKNKESKRFTKCFHGWGPHKKPPE